MKTKLLTKKDVAAALSMSTRSVDRLVASGALKPIRISLAGIDFSFPLPL